MFFKVALLCCAQLLTVNLSAAQYIGSGYGFGAGGCCGAAVAPINAGCAPITSSGGGFIVSSSSPINPSGLYVLSENTIEGNLGVNGQIPFLGAVSLEGDVPSQGNTAVQYNCGGCDIGITAENRNAAPVGPCCGAGAGAGLAGPGIGFGVSGAGLGYSGAGAGFGFGAAGAGLGYGGAGAGLGYGAGGAGLGYGAADAGLGYGTAGTGLGYGGLGSGYGTGYGAGYGYGLGSAIY